MIVLPEVRAIERTTHGVCLTLAVPPDLEYFDGHFPQVPLLPGVVQVTWAIQLGRAHLPLDAEFRGLSAVKFTRVIQPGSTVTLRLDHASEEQKLHFSYELDGQSCSNGTVLFDAR